MYLSEKPKVGVECMVFREKWTDKHCYVAMNEKLCISFVVKVSCYYCQSLKCPVTTANH